MRTLRRYAKATMALAFLGYVFYHMNKDFVEKPKDETVSE